MTLLRTEFYRYYFLLSVLCAGLIQGCQYLPDSDAEIVSPASGTSKATQDSTVSQPSDNSVTTQTTTPVQRERSREEIVAIGTNNYIATPGTTSDVRQSEAGDITLNFQGTELQEFIKAILGNILNENYIIDPEVTGYVTVQTSRPIPKSELFPMFESILELNNVAIIRKNNVYQIVPDSQAIRGNIAPSTVTTKSDEGYGVRIIPLQYIAAQEMQKILEPFVADGNDIRVDIKRNLVIITGTSQQIDTVQQTIDVFDVDWLRGMSVGLYPLEYVDPVTLKGELDDVISSIAGDEKNQLLGGMVRTVPLERLNSILLIGSTASALREVEIWLHRLDKPGDHAGKRLFVYNVQNAKATELAAILNQIFKSRNAANPAQRALELAPGHEPVEISNDRPTPFNDASATADSIAISANNSIEIIADEVRNALVILASQQEYMMVEAALAKLDLVPLQVLIEASIIEVTLDDKLNLGVEWFFNNQVADNYEGNGRLDLGDSGIAALSPSFSYSIIRNAADVRVALNALASESNIKVLSSPSLMVLDNKTAMINIGDEIPVPTRQSVSTIDPNAPAVNEIQFRKTGVTLTVTPRVNQGGLVTMAVKQEVSNAISTTSSNIDAPTIQQRQIESEVAINSGETIVLGGLIQETKSNGNSGVPGLRNIPLLGALFSQTADENHRTELLVLITPRVVGNRNDARDITDEFRKKLQGLEPPI